LLRQSITDEQADVKKISAQIADEHGDVKKMSALISTLITKVDALQNSSAPAITSSIPKGQARARLVTHKKSARVVKPTGLISLEGVPLTVASPGFTF
jgi:uncharacterized coiled-coil protein SlyX